MIKKTFACQNEDVKRFISKVKGIYYKYIDQVSHKTVIETGRQRFYINVMSEKFNVSGGKITVVDITNKRGIGFSGGASLRKSYSCVAKVACNPTAIVKIGKTYVAYANVATKATTTPRLDAQHRCDGKSAANAVSYYDKIEIVVDRWDGPSTDTALIATGSHSFLVGSTGQITVTSSQGRTITYTSSDPSIASIGVNTGAISVASLLGSVSFTVHIAANTYFPAETIIGGTHNLGKYNPTINMADDTVVYDGGLHGLAATTSNPSGLTIAYLYVGLNYSSNTPPSNAGIYSVSATTTETVNYNAVSKTAYLTISKATPVITWALPGNIDAGVPFDDTIIDATANVTGTWVFSVDSAIIAAGTTTDIDGTLFTEIVKVGDSWFTPDLLGRESIDVTIDYVFTPSDQNNYNVATGWEGTWVTLKTPGIVWPDPATLAYPDPLQDFYTQIRGQITGDNVKGSFIFTDPSYTHPVDETTPIILPVAGNSAYPIYYHFESNDKYIKSVNGVGYLEVVKGDRTVYEGTTTYLGTTGDWLSTGTSLTVSDNDTRGFVVKLSDDTFCNLSLTQTGTQAVVFLNNNAWAIYRLQGPQPPGHFTVHYTASANDNYNTVSGSFITTIATRRSQTISPITVTGSILSRGGGWGQISGAVASSGLPVTFSTSTALASISNTYKRVYCYTGGTTFTLYANQEGDATYAPAPTVSLTITVPQSKVYFELAPYIVGQQSFANCQQNFRGGSGTYNLTSFGTFNNISVVYTPSPHPTSMHFVSATNPYCYQADGYYVLTDANDSTNVATLYYRDWLPLITFNGLNFQPCTATPVPGGGTVGTVVTLADTWSATINFTIGFAGHTRNLIMVLNSSGTGMFQSDDYIDLENMGEPQIGLGVSWSVDSDGFMLIASGDVTTSDGQPYYSPWRIKTKLPVVYGTNNVEVSFSHIRWSNGASPGAFSWSGGGYTYTPGIGGSYPIEEVAGTGVITRN